MATVVYTSPISNATDAAFRIWVQELSDALTTVGMTLTSDTGQVNISTATISSTNYQIRTFPGTSPLYLRIEYTFISSSTVPSIRYIIGTGSNGSGTLTGVVSTTAITGNTLLSTTVPYTTYISCSSLFFGIVFKAGATATNNDRGNSVSVFFACRSTTPTGVGDGVGYTMYYATTPFVAGAGTGANAFIVGFYRIAGPTPGTVFQQPVAGSTQATSWFIPARVTSSITTTGDVQTYIVWSNLPDIVPLKQLCGYITSEIPTFTTFQNTTVGNTPATFLTLGNSSGSGNGVASGTNSLAMIWE